MLYEVILQSRYLGNHDLLSSRCLRQSGEALEALGRAELITVLGGELVDLNSVLGRIQKDERVCVRVILPVAQSFRSTSTISCLLFASFVRIDLQK